MKLTDILTNLASIHATVKQRGNEALANLGPLDQIDAAQPIRYALQELEWGMKRIKEVEESVNAALSDLPQMEKDIVTASLAKMVEDGDVVQKDKVELLIASAKTEAKQDITNEFEAYKTVANRRSEITESHGEVIASALSEEVLGGEDYKKGADIVLARINTLKENNITKEQTPGYFGKFVSIALCEAGEGQFNQMLTETQELLNVSGLAKPKQKIGLVTAGSGLANPAINPVGTPSTVDYVPKF